MRGRVGPRQGECSEPAVLRSAPVLTRGVERIPPPVSGTGGLCFIQGLVGIILYLPVIV